ncbi:hypothetical protein ACPPVW_17450 [Leifsonia sp. McL0607]|uniref:hypothetical protein n=1 Tax=Leifsonia sp. McL0607 TaxID=3415672 RepID=UPI003CFA43F7
MSIFARRPIDLARQAAAVASEAGWVIERWVDEEEVGKLGEDGRRLDGRRLDVRGVDVHGVDGRGADVHGVGVHGWTCSGSIAWSGASVSIVVSGGALRGPARLTLAVRGDGDASSAEGSSGVASEHVPRTLPPPQLRATRAARSRALVVRLVEHPARGTLDGLLARGAGLAAGEAVTVLAAVARGLADFHTCGRAGALLAPSDIGFRDDGCPILTGIDLLRPLDHAAAQRDVDAYAALAATVCTAVSGERGAALLAAATESGHRSWDDVIRAVLHTADPIAIAWGPEAESRAPARAPGAEDAAPRGWESAAYCGASPTRPAGAHRDGRSPGWAVSDGGSRGLVQGPTDGSWDLEATLRREVVRGAVSSVPSDGSWELEATVRRDSVRSSALSARDGDRRAPIPVATGSGRPEVERSSPSQVASSEVARWEVVRSQVEAAEVARSQVEAAEVARSEGIRPRRSSQHAPERGGGPSERSGRVLTAMERLLDEVGDRPVGRAVGSLRSWAAARPLLVTIAVVPLVGVLLALLLFPVDEVQGDVVGRSSSALLRESGTGPNRCSSG